MAVRNLIRTGVLDQVAKSFEVVLVAPFAEDPAFREEFEGSGIVPVSLPIEDAGLRLLARRVMLTALQRRAIREQKIDTLIIQEERLRRSRPWYHLLRSLLATADRGRLMESLARRVWQRGWAADAMYRELFARYQPAAVVSVHPYSPTDWPLLWHAQRRGVPTIGVVHSWDNVTARYVMPFPPSRLLVSSEELKREVLHYYSWLRPEDVVATGAPQYDLFVDPDRVETREQFLTGLGMDPERALITFAGGGEVLFPHEGKVAEMLAEAVEEERFCRPAQLWVRFYGDASTERNYQALGGRRHVRWEQAPAEFWGAFRVTHEWETGDGLQHYTNLLRHSDVVVCMASTVSLDSLVVDTAVVNAALDGPEPLHFLDSVRRVFFAFNHNRRVARSGATRTALDAEELIGYVGAYLAGATPPAELRRDLLAEVCGPLDGRSARRMAEAIVSFVQGPVRGAAC